MRRALALLVSFAVLSALAMPAVGETRPRARKAALSAFRSCDALLSHARSRATQMVGTGWVPVMGAPEGASGAPPPQTDAGAREQQVATAPAPGAGGATPDFSTTNVQEEGVDEPDVVKTDGRRIYAVANGSLHVADARSDPPRLLGSLRLQEGSGHELLLHGERLLVLQNAWVLERRDLARPVARLTEVDVSDPAALEVLRTDRIDGSYVTARRTGDVARVVIATPSRALEPLAAVTRRGRAGRAQRRAIIRRTTLKRWRPRAFSRDRVRARAALYPIVPCREVRRPAEAAGLGMVTVLTIDLDRGLPATDADAIMADAETVYGSPSRLYVATRRWLSPQAASGREPPKLTTQIHAFDASRRDRTEYTGTGEVDGFLLSQFALSEHEGALRVASTETPEWWAGRASRDESESFVTALDARTLRPLGRVGGLGRGERIFAVRFLGDVGYVVTFRQTDPLYTVDVSDPSRPRVTGELKIEGYSAYLHPIGERLLLGVGQDADRRGRTRGTQLSVFDVSDPANPIRTAVRALGDDSSSSVEFDHRAFLWWPPRQLAVVPLVAYGTEDDGVPFAGAAGFGVSRQDLEQRGRIQHPFARHPAPIVRSLVVGERLFTLSARGLLTSDLTTLEAGPWLPFPDAPAEDGPQEPEPMAVGRPGG